jgi:beta-glucosidase
MGNIQKKTGKVGIIMVGALLAIMLILTIVSLGYYNVITQFFSKPNVNPGETEAAAAAARKIIERIESEGIVLLRNENNALPLNRSGESRVNTFGWSSISPVYSGIGSGAGNEANAVTYLDGLENAGFSVNTELVQFYENSGISQKNKDSFGSFSTDYAKHLVPRDQYPQELLNNTKNFSDVALIFLSRIGGEGSSDLPLDMSELGGRRDEHYLELSDGEKGLIDMVDRLNFKKVILIINSSFPLELNFLEDGKIDAAIWIGGPGETGMNAVGSVLSGQVNPSGRTVYTYARDLTSSPAMMAYGDRYYRGTEYMDVDWNGKEHEAHQGFVDYLEGVYVGYRYYETRYIDNKTGECDENAYRAAVQFPFGYGLSYTAFKQEIESFSAVNGRITLNARVTNTGNTAGKDVVQVYYTAPYILGGIEKSHVVLGGFGKTGMLKPGISETVQVSFAVEDMASFDYKDKDCYVLDAGTYEIKLMANAHGVIDSRNYTVDSTVVYDENNKRSSDKIPAVSRFKDAEGDVKITYVSRADWEGTLPSNVSMSRDPTKELSAQWYDFSPPEDPSAQDIVIRNNGRKLKEYIGLAYDDPQWEELLQQLSVKDMQYLIGWGGFATQVIKSVDKPYAIDLDGPSGLKALVNETAYNGAGYTTGVVVAGTWNTELVKEMGEYFSAEAAAWKTSGIYGPSMNILRIPFGARNYEYFSEDSLLTGKTTASIVTGFNTNKVYNFIKHFALYNQCVNFGRLTTWSNEQAVREIYLRGFEIAVKEAGVHAVMSSYNRIGNTWAGASKTLLTDVLRNEWGFEGMVISDWVAAPFMNAEQGIHAGNDLMLNTLGSTVNDTSNAGKQAMRKACHNILYTVVNSNAMEISYYGPTPYWLYIMIAVDLLVVLGAVFFFYKWNKRRKAYTQ